MKQYNNLKIGTRMIIGFLVIAMLAGIIGAVGVKNVQAINADYSMNYEASLNALDSMEQVSASFQKIRMNLTALVLSNNATDKKFYMDKISEWTAEVDDGIAKYRKVLDAFESSLVIEELGLLDSIDNQFAVYESKKDTFVAQYAMDAGRQQEAFEQLKDKGELRQLALGVDAAVEALILYNLQYGQDINAANSAAAALSVKIMVITALLGMLLSIVIGLYIARGVSKPIGKLLEASDKLALGDVNFDIQASSKDEIGNLSRAFMKMTQSIREQAVAVEKIAGGDFTTQINVRSEHDLLGMKLTQLIERMNEMLSNISIASVQIASGSKQISDAGIAISQGATEQASAIEELTASIDEIAAQTKKSAENAVLANELAVTVESNAAEGSTQMQEMLGAMDEINVSSRNINKIIKVIDDIAFQTNILALNAAVEAARAGQHGKGFAVVAEEVRTLAGRSASAASETTEMIENSIKKAQGGTIIAQNTAQALTKIVSGIGKVAGLVGQISNDTTAQSTSIVQISQGILQIYDVVQANSATSEETAASSEELTMQADLLKDQVAQFKLN